MHKRNIACTALVLATIITGIFFVYPELSLPAFLRWLYAPAILLTILLSESSHDPSAVTVWVNFVIFTLIYWVIIWFFIAFTSELVMIRRGLRYLGDVEDNGTAGKAGTKKFPQQVLQAFLAQQQESVEDYSIPVKAQAEMYLEQFGKALKVIEGGRRNNFLLQNMDMLNLEEADDLLAKHAISKAANERPVRALLKKLESTLEINLGSRTAAMKFMNMLKREAHNIDAAPKHAPEK